MCAVVTCVIYVLLAITNEINKTLWAFYVHLYMYKALNNYRKYSVFKYSSKRKNNTTNEIMMTCVIDKFAYLMRKDLKECGHV